MVVPQSKRVRGSALCQLVVMTAATAAVMTAATATVMTAATATVVTAATAAVMTATKAAVPPMAAVKCETIITTAAAAMANPVSSKKKT